jgi:hypothetical protein
MSRMCRIFMDSRGAFFGSPSVVRTLSESDQKVASILSWGSTAPRFSPISQSSQAQHVLPQLFQMPRRYSGRSRSNRIAQNETSLGGAWKGGMIPGKPNLGDDAEAACQLGASPVIGAVLVGCIPKDVQHQRVNRGSCLSCSCCFARSPVRRDHDVKSHDISC